MDAVKIASCKDILLLECETTWAIHDGHLLYEMEKHEAHLIFINFLGQVMAGKKPEIDLSLLDGGKDVA